MSPHFNQKWEVGIALGAFVDAPPEIEDDRLLGHLVPHAVHGELLIVVHDPRRVPARHDHDVAVVGLGWFRDRDRGGCLRLAVSGLKEQTERESGTGEVGRGRTKANEDMVCGVGRAHPFASRWRHASHRRVEAVEVPMLLAKVARDYTVLLGERGRLVALIAEHRLAKLILEAVPIAVFLPYRSSTDTNSIGSQSLPCDAPHVRERQRT